MSSYPRISLSKLSVDYKDYRPNFRQPVQYVHILQIELCCLGTAIPKGYHVHHINSDHGDYSLCNLALLTEKEHELQQTFPSYWTAEELIEISRHNVQTIRNSTIGINPLNSPLL